MKKLTAFLFIFLLNSQPALYSQPHPSIHQQQLEQHKNKESSQLEISEVLTGLDILINSQNHRLTGKTVGLVTNRSGIDREGIPNYQRLMKLDDVNLKIIFSPEHSLFGEAATGEKVEYDREKNFPEIFSLYGKTKTPSPESLAGLDLIIYDIQDIGARFYTYISTLGLVMESAAKAGIPVMVLDRPNPITGEHVEGPILDPDFRSFVGYYPIPVRYGMTIGELARMIIGEKWIDPIPELIVIPMENWSRNLWYDEINLSWVRPSPNIPDLETAVIYPGLCLLEGTNISEGHGTYHPFKWFGAPWINGQLLSQKLNNLHLPGVVFKPIRFTPQDIPGMTNNPKYEGELCEGIEINIINRNEYLSVTTGIHILTTLQSMYPTYFKINPKTLQRLWGSSYLTQALESRLNAGEIINSFQNKKLKFEALRNKYCLYKIP